MNNNYKNVLAVLGIVFIGILLIALGFYIALSTMGGAGIKAIVPFGRSEDAKNSPAATESIGFSLSEEQKQALVSLGIDPAVVPDTITPDQQNCLVENLGEEKFSSIKGGEVPSPFDFLKMKGCL